MGFFQMDAYEHFLGHSIITSTTSHEALERAKAVDLLTLARTYGARLKHEGGGEWCGPCIVCGGTNRFHLNRKKALWGCRGCGKGGDAINLVRHVNTGATFADAVRELAGESPTAPSGRAPQPNSEPKARDAETTKASTAKALKVWNDSIAPFGTLAQTYLRSRAIQLSEKSASDVLRFHQRSGTRAMDGCLR
jgi:phage/plasmid primase-like uncharacterized protein